MAGGDGEDAVADGDVVAAAGGTWLNKADEDGIRKAAELAKNI